MDAATLTVTLSVALPAHSILTQCMSQRLHQLEGAADLSPSESVSAPVSKLQNLAHLNTDTQEAFPSLAPSPGATAKPIASAWSAAAGPRLAAHTPQATESFTLSAIDLSSAGK